MYLKLITRLLFAGVLFVFAVSCIENDIQVAPPRTLGDEMQTLEIYIDTLHNRGLDVDTTDMGVYYVINEEGTGPFPVDGDTCIVKYNGFLMDGTLFDASFTHSADSTFEFVLNGGNMIKGWTDGMRVINEGAKAYLIIPSEFAYGSTGTYGIQPYETLIFGIDMVDIKQAY